MRISLTKSADGDFETIEVDTSTPSPNEADYVCQVLESVVGAPLPAPPVASPFAKSTIQRLLEEYRAGEGGAEDTPVTFYGYVPDPETDMDLDDNLDMVDPKGDPDVSADVPSDVDRLHTSDHIFEWISQAERDPFSNTEDMFKDATLLWARAIVDVIRQFEGSDRDAVVEALALEMDAQGAHTDKPVHIARGDWLRDMPVAETSHLNKDIPSAGLSLQHVSAPYPDPEGDPEGESGEGPRASVPEAGRKSRPPTDEEDAAEEDGYDGPMPGALDVAVHKGGPYGFDPSAHGYKGNLHLVCNTEHEPYESCPSVVARDSGEQA